MMASSSPEFSASSARVPLWRQKLDASWRWWTDELAHLVPERFARGTRVPVLMQESGGDIVLVEPRAAAGPEARVALAALDPAQARTALAALLQRAGETRARARLCLDRQEALLRRISMPAATEENLAQVVGFEMDRLTPFRADEVYFDQRVVARDPASAQIAVQLAVARREVVDAHLARLRDLGVSVQGVTVREENPGQHAAFDLLPTAQRGERESPNDRLLRNVLLGTAAVLLLAAMLLPAWQKRETVIAALPLLEKARQDAESTDALSRTLERQVADYNFLLAKKHAPGALAYLEDLSRLLPDNTWVQQFDLRSAGKSREVQITGETTSSSKLIELLEQSTLLQNATPRGTVTRGSQPGTERFMIAAETRPRPLPAMLPAREVGAMPMAPPIAAAPPPAVEPPPPVAGAAVSPSGGVANVEVTQGAAAPPPAPVTPAPTGAVPPPSPPVRATDPQGGRPVPKTAAEREALIAERAARMRQDRARREDASRAASERARAQHQQSGNR
jgi:general secretion pathway protein L